MLIACMARSLDLVWTPASTIVVIVYDKHVNGLVAPNSSLPQSCSCAALRMARSLCYRLKNTFFKQATVQKGKIQYVR